MRSVSAGSRRVRRCTSGDNAPGVASPVRSRLNVSLSCSTVSAIPASILSRSSGTWARGEGEDSEAPARYVRYLGETEPVRTSAGSKVRTGALPALPMFLPVPFAFAFAFPAGGGEARGEATGGVSRQCCSSSIGTRK